MPRAQMPVACLVMAATACATPAPETLVQLRGKLRYHAREVRADLSGLSPPAWSWGRGVPFIIHAGDKVLARGATTAGGAWAAHVPQSLGPDARITFTTVGHDRRGRPRHAVARAGAAERASAGVWAWTFPASTGLASVVEAKGAGALRLWEAMAFTIDFATRMFGRVDAPTLAVLWSPGRAFACHACFEDAGGQGATVAGHKYESVIWLDGTDHLAQAWTDSVVTHEIGHWVMAVYSRLPEDDREHTLVDKLAPQTAWLEGWATFFAQVALSARRGVDQPRVVAVTDGVAYAFDLRTGAYRDPTMPADRLALPDPRAGIGQDLAEGVVAAILWGLRGVAGERAVLLGITSPRMTDRFVDRGARGRDLVDFLDAIVCDGRVTAAQVDAVVRGRFRFPYDAPPPCAGKK